MRLAIGDSLLIAQSSLSVTKPWAYILLDMETSGVVTSGSEAVADYVIIQITSVLFSAYIGKSIGVFILDGVGGVLEEDVCIISGPYSKLDNLKYMVGLLGENQKQDSSGNTDFQDGHKKNSNISIYTDNTLTSELETYNFSRSYVSNFTPDYRYHILKEIQKAT